MAAASEALGRAQVIAINQDALGRQGAPVWSNCPPFEPCAVMRSE